MRRDLTAIALLACSASAHAQGVPLDKLNNCSAVTQASGWLSGVAGIAVDHCRLPRDAIEKRLLADWTSTFDSKGRQSCMVAAPVLSALKGFSCLTTRKDKRPTSFFCFRRVNSAPLLAYRENYAQVYARRVANYFADSAKCDGVAQSGHKARISGVSMPSTDMLSIATPAFGYESRLRSNAGQARVEHGFAFLDPALTSDGKGAIEYVSGDNGQGLSFDRVVQGSLRAGEWTVDTARIDDMIALGRDMAAINPSMRGALSGAAAAASDLEIGGLYLSVTSPNPTDRNDADKTALRKGWFDKLGATFKSWKLDPVSRADLVKQGIDPAAFENGVDMALPYGLKGQAAAFKPKFAGAWAGEQASCGQDHGGYLVFGQDVPPSSAKRSEFGTLALTLIAVSSCRKSAGGPGISGLATRVTNAFSTSITGATP
jgi:hypothetical protein